jgi:hypothetical protein
MSTRINVNIGDGGLLDRNAQQQAAARQANQQRAAADKAAAEGQRQLEQERIRNGLDPGTGERLPSASSSSRIQRIDQEPAAFRREDPLSIGHLWFNSVSLTNNFAFNFPEEDDSYNATYFAGRTRTEQLICGNGTVDTVLNYGTGPVINVPQQSPPYPSDVGEGDDFFAGSAGTFFTGTFLDYARYEERMNHMVLPAGKDACIFVFIYRVHWYYYNITTQGHASLVLTAQGPQPRTTMAILDTGISATQYAGNTRLTRCFYASNTALRELAVPSGLEAMINAGLPTGQGIVNVALSSPNTSLELKMSLTYGPQTAPWFGTDTLETTVNITEGFAESFFVENRVSPSIYKVVNNSSQFVDPARIKSFPKTGVRYPMPDGSSGGYTPFTNNPFPSPSTKSIYTSGQPLRYAVWPVPNAAGDITVWDTPRPPLPVPIKRPNATLQFAPDRVALQESSTSGATDFYVVYDWNDPAYCRLMLTSLGFSSADLSP